MAAMLKSSTHQPPLFRFKIESFSSLLKSCSTERFESCEFEVGDYKWKLSVYANRNDHISLYLVLADTSCLDDKKELLVSFCLLVFDQILSKYFKAHVMSSFHAKNSESGFEMFLPLNIFKDPSNGYLVNDTCVFGAEICSIDNKQCLSEKKIEHVPFWFSKQSFFEKRFQWKLEKFSTLKKGTGCSLTKLNAFYKLSEKFTVKGHDFNLVLFPKGSSSGAGNSLSLYLSLADPKKFPSGKKLHVKFTLRIINQVNKKYTKEASDQHTFSSEVLYGWGFHEFLSLKKLTSGYLVNDTLMFEADVIECDLANDWV